MTYHNGTLNDSKTQSLVDSSSLDDCLSVMITMVGEQRVDLEETTGPYLWRNQARDIYKYDINLDRTEQAQGRI